VAAKRFRAVLRPTGRTATYVEVPFDPREVFGTGRPPVRGTVNGFPFRTTLARRGGEWYMVVNRAVREGARAEAGQRVVVEMERDDEPRDVPVPDDLRAALAGDDTARSYFEELPYSHRKEYVDWITEAKRAETRARRIAKAVGLLREGRKAR
jgi:Bacteriocin-protection, YdeI or OmpD-Associated/Domain of unknown function (DUF1905)